MSNDRDAVFDNDDWEDEADEIEADKCSSTLSLKSYQTIRYCFDPTL